MLSTFKCAAPLGAAAVALGLSQAVPGIAAADDSQPGSPASSPAASSESSESSTQKSAPARRSARESRAATGKTTAARIANPNRTRAESPVAAARTARPTGDAPDRTPPTPSIDTAARPDPAAAAPSVSASAATPQTLRRAPRAAATIGIVSAPGTARAMAAATDPFSALFTPIQGFLEGAALLIRRTLFNQAPSVTPVQLTGQSTGAITGKVGALDPEGDPIVYSITRSAQYGSVVVASDGSYTYTPGTSFNGTDTFTVAATDTGFHINLLDLFRAASTPANVVVKQGAAAANL